MHPRDMLRRRSSFAVGVLVIAIAGCAPVAAEGATDESALSKSCGNGTCSGRETCSTCPADCGGCASDSGTPAPDSGTPAADSGTPTADAGGAGGSCVSPYVVVPAGSTTTQIQAQLDAAAVGTSFCFQPGTYVTTTWLYPRDGQKLVCGARRTCTLTGQDTYAGGIKAYGGEAGSTDIVVQGFIVERFANDPSQPGFFCALSAGWRAQIIDNEIRYNDDRDVPLPDGTWYGGCGVSVPTGGVIRGNYIHHNTCIGVNGGPAVDATQLIENNEISFNNSEDGWTGHCSGMKVIGSTAGNYGTTMRGNVVHDNRGNGLWIDTNVYNAVFEGNTVYGNLEAGIDVETSYNAIVRNNVVTNNMINGDGISASCYNANIISYESAGTQIYGNTVEAPNGENGICLATGTRTPGTRDVIVRDNVIKMRREAGQTSGPYSGAAYCCDPALNVHFENNDYYVDDVAGVRWQWLTPLTWSQWQMAGNDVTGSVTIW